MSRASMKPDALLLSVLMAAPSVSHALVTLKMSGEYLKRRCATGELAVAYRACAARGWKRRLTRKWKARGLLAMTEAELDALEASRPAVAASGRAKRPKSLEVA